MEPKDTILIIDDTPANLIHTIEFLNIKGFKILIAKGGLEGIDMAKLTHPDVILLDVMMPDIEGFQVCQHLKAQEATRDTPIIFMSALNEVSNKVQGFSVGAADYVTKPFEQEELLVRINTHLKLSKLQRQLLHQNQILQQEIILRQHTEETLQIVLNATTDVIMMFDQKGICKLVNPKGANKLGMEIVQMMNYPIEDIFPQELSEQMKTMMNRVLNTQQSELFEIGFNQLWFEVNGDYIENGKGVVFYARDITGRKEVCKALQLSQERYVLAVGSGKVGVWDWNIETQEFYCDTTLDGELPKSFHAWLRLIHTEDRERIFQNIHRCLQEPLSSYEFEYRMAHQNGCIRWFTAQGSILRYPQGHVYRLVGTVTDMTEQKYMQEALRVSHERFSTVLDSLEIGIYVVDLKTHQFLFMNQYFKEFCCHEKDFPKHCWEAFYPERHTPCHFCANFNTDQFSGIHWWEVYHAESKKWFYGQSRTVRWIDGEWVGLEVITDITARKQTEESLRQSEKRFELAVRGANDGIWDYNLKTHEVYYSPRWKQILGYHEDELGSQLEEMTHRLHREDRDVVLDKLHTYLEKKSSTYEVTYRMQHRLGHYVWILARGIALWDETGKPLRMVGTHMDLTAQKQTEAHVAQLGQLTEQLLKLPLIIFRMTLEGILIEAQGAGLALLGLEPKKVKGLNLFKVFPKAYQYVELVLAGTSQHFSYPFQYKKRTLCYETFLTLDKTENSLIGIALDISEQTAAIEALHEHEEYHHTLIREASIGLGLFENDVLVEANPAFAKILGYSLEEIYDQGLRCYIQEFTPPQYVDIDVEQQRLLEQKGRFGPYEKECFHKNGYLVPVRLSGVVVQYKQRHFLWSTLEDISDRKRVEEALRQAKDSAESANYTKTAFLANMSHELRTPLNGILGHTQLLVQDKSLTAQHIENIMIIQRNGEYLLTLIGDILDLAKIETQHLELFPTIFLFEQFIKEINEFTELNASQRGLTFYYQALTPLPKIVRADEIRLRQVLINLLSNAIKFTKKGEIWFKVSTNKASETNQSKKLPLCFQIEDTGIGMSPQELSMIFTPFQQFGERNYRDRGTGLGLALSKRLIELMGGQLHLESALGQGTKVWVDIEVELEEKCLPAQEELSLGIEGTLLIVDDQGQQHPTVVNLLTSLGFKVVETKSSQEALNQALQYPPHGMLIASDLFMMNECEAIAQIKQLSKLKKIPLMVCSHSFQQINIEGKEISFQDEGLLEKLRSCLKTKQLSERAISLAPQGIKIEDFSSVTGPSSEEASQLLRLAKMGDVYGVFDFLERLEKKHPTLLPFIEKVRLLAKQFDHEMICEVARFYL